MLSGLPVHCISMLNELGKWWEEKGRETYTAD